MHTFPFNLLKAPASFDHAIKSWIKYIGLKGKQFPKYFITFQFCSTVNTGGIIETLQTKVKQTMNSVDFGISLNSAGVRKRFQA